MSLKNLVSSTTVDINCDQLIYDSKTISAITTDTLEVGTLSFASTIDGFTQTTLTSGVSGGTFLVPPTVTATIRKFGDKVFIQFDDFISTTINPDPNDTFTTTTPIAAGYRPAAETYIPCVFIMDGANVVGHIEINNTGFLTFALNEGTPITANVQFGLNKIAFTYLV